MTMQNKQMMVVLYCTLIDYSYHVVSMYDTVVMRLLTLFYIDDGLAIIATTVPRVTHTHQTLITTNA